MPTPNSFDLEADSFDWLSTIKVQTVGDGDEHYRFQSASCGMILGSSKFELLTMDKKLIMSIGTVEWNWDGQWELDVRDCNGNLMFRMKDDPWARYCWGINCQDLSLTMKYPDGTVFAYTQRDKKWFSDEVKLYSTELGAGSTPAATGKVDAQFFDNNPEYHITINNPNVAAGDPRFISALMAYKMWKDCEGDDWGDDDDDDDEKSCQTIKSGWCGNFVWMAFGLAVFCICGCIAAIMRLMNNRDKGMPCTNP